MALSGRLALVTGGGSGIGRAVCQVLARDCARVVVADISMDHCAETEKVIKYSLSSNLAKMFRFSRVYGVMTTCP